MRYQVYILGNAAGRPMINAVGKPKIIINGTCLDYLAESFMAGDPHNGGGFVIVNGIELSDQGNVLDLDEPYPGSNLFSLASGGAIFFEADTVNVAGTISAVGGISQTQQLAGSIGGSGGQGRIRFNYSNSYANTGTQTPAVGYTGAPIGSFSSSGTMETPVQTVSNLCSWGNFTYVADTSVTGTSITADILSATGSTLASNVASGTDLSTLPALTGVSQIRLRFNFASTPEMMSTRNGRLTIAVHSGGSVRIWYFRRSTWP